MSSPIPILVDDTSPFKVGDIVEIDLEGFRGQTYFVTSFMLGHGNVELDTFPRSLSYITMDAMHVRRVDPGALAVERAMSLTQPWGGLMATGIKPIENRNRPLIAPKHFGKPIALHATREIDQPVFKRAIEIAPELAPRGPYTIADDPWVKLGNITSAIIGVATPVALIKGIRRATTKDTGEIPALYYPPTNLPGATTRWMFGEFCYLFRDAKVLPTPIKIGGKQGCWPLPLDVQRQIAAQLHECVVGNPYCKYVDMCRACSTKGQA